MLNIRPSAEADVSPEPALVGTIGRRRRRASGGTAVPASVASESPTRPRWLQQHGSPSRGRQSAVTAQARFATRKCTHA